RPTSRSTAGFREGRSCTDQTATLRIIVEQSIECNLSLYIKTTSVTEKIVNIILNSYDGLNCKIMHGGQLKDSLEVKACVRQGCLLSPFLFLLMIDWIMMSIFGEKHGIQWTAMMQLDGLDFADELALLLHTQQQMQEKTASVAAASAAVGLNMHKKKSKILRYNTASTNRITLG
ncbi:unnamed protein product, partial [Schistosoma curassoni]|uniref:Reverse transcriptase domain-containing protein n=1 Tax=Schistosoma curassoni TaxID=6186 RepID=A0A183L039_9TREM